MSFFALFFALVNMFAPIHHGVPHAAMRPMDTIGGGLPHGTATPAPAIASTSSVKPFDTIGGGLPH